MSVPSIIFLALSALAAALLVWRFGRWLAGSWEVLDDDQLHDRLSRGSEAPPLAWLRLTGRLRGGPRRLTYRRDKRGRFRKIRR